LQKMELWLVPGMLCFGLINCLKSLFVKSNFLKPVSKATVLQHLTRAITGIALGLYSANYHNLVLANVVAYFIGAVAMISALRFKSASFRITSLSRLSVLFRHHFSTAFVSSLTSLVNVVSASLVLILVIRNYSVVEGGWYSFIMSISAGPLLLITSALGQAYWGHSSKLVSNRDYAELNSHFMTITFRLLCLGIPVVLLCSLGPLLIPALLGEEKWGSAGLLLPCMIPLLVGMLAFSPTNHLIVIGRQHYQLILDGLKIFLILMSFEICFVLNLSVYVAVFLSSLASLATYILLFVIHIRRHKELQQADIKGQ